MNKLIKPTMHFLAMLLTSFAPLLPPSSPTPFTLPSFVV